MATLPLTPATPGTLTFTAVTERPLTTSAAPPLETSPLLLTEVALTLAGAAAGTVPLTPAV
jgi:hypothetical protein